MKSVKNILPGVQSPQDLKILDSSELNILADEIREFLINKVAVTGGHLASNLGVVELTLALHKVFDTPRDKIVWDVGHQTYVHKILTGRKEEFNTLRKLNGLSGFPKTKESPHDCFNTGHSSTSISAGLGIAKARDIKGENYSVISVIGDGALTGGMSFEALNDAGRSPNNFIVILNDNEMSISKNVGGLSRYLSHIRTEPIYFKVKEDIDIILNKIPAIGKSAVKVLDRAKGTLKYILLPGVIFEELGFKYLGPIDGHDIEALVDVLSRAKMLKGPVFIHVCTKKGKGYEYAEQKPQSFHSISPFSVETGEALKSGDVTYSEIFSRKLVELGGKDDTVCAITAAMPDGTGLKTFAKEYPSRFFDVGIAEQHAVTFAAGLASNGLKPVVAIYSSFLQRAYDQTLHDVAIQNLHVVFAIDRAGIIGEDGETHQGLYDLSFLSHIPNMTIMAPCDYYEFGHMLDYALESHCGPIAMRYPKGAGPEKLDFEWKPISEGHGVLCREGEDISIVAVGAMVETALKVASALEKFGKTSDVINARFAKPLDSRLISASARKTGRVWVLEDNTVIGGFGSSVLCMLNENGVDAAVRIMAFPDRFIAQGSRNELFKKYKMDYESITMEILKNIK